MNITPTQYAKAKGITLAAVTRAIREKRKLPEVKLVTKYGRFYILQVKKDFCLVK